MRSVYVRILVWFFGTLALSMIAFVLVWRFISLRSFAGKPTELNAMMLEEATEAYESGGSQKLKDRMKYLHQFFPGEHYLTDANGFDLATGKDRSSLLALIRSEWGVAKRSQGCFIMGTASSNGRYRLIAVLPLPFEVWPSILYYLLILLAVGMVCWALALSIASPLRNLARVVDRFGRGELSVRVKSRRRDEIGALAAAFDLMAERIETLLTSERRLLQDISHELRSPLARLSFAAELVRTAEDRDVAVWRFKKEINRLTHLVSALVEMVRAEEDTTSCNLEEVRLDTILNEVVADCEVEAAARNCRINIDADSNLGMLGNGELLRRAFENILRNAIHYTPEGTAVDVTLKACADTVLITVRDYGPGVPEGLLSKIFQPFFRVDDSRDNMTGGVGLGLAIAHRAIKVHHGRLHVENVNTGLLVRIEFPKD